MVNNLKLLLLILTSLVAFQTEALSQIPVEVVDYSEDMVGQMLVYRVKEKFRESNIFYLPLVSKGFRFRVQISTMDRFKGDNFRSNVSTIYSVVWLLYDDEKLVFPIYLDHTLGYSGRDVVGVTAEEIVARTDKIVTQFGELLKMLDRLLKPEDK
ncbi:MAG: hypothetical protein ACK44H_06435 [Candidatus Kryptonium sp.]